VPQPSAPRRCPSASLHAHATPRAHNCRHCGRDYSSLRRGLCRPCWRIPDIRQQYPAAVNQLGGNRDRGAGSNWHDLNGARPLPTPTCAIPGSEAKIAELMARAERREALFHPADAALPAALALTDDGVPGGALRLVVCQGAHATAPRGRCPSRAARWWESLSAPGGRVLG